MIEDKKSFVHVTPHLKQQLAFFSSHALVVSRFTTCDSIAYHLFSTRRYDLKKSCPCPLVVPLCWTKLDVNFTCDCQHSLMPASNHTISNDEQKFQHDFFDHQQIVRRSSDSRMIRKIWKMNIFLSRWSRPRGNQERGQPPVKVNVIHTQMLIQPLPGLLHPLLS